MDSRFRRLYNLLFQRRNISSETVERGYVVRTTSSLSLSFLMFVYLFVFGLTMTLVTSSEGLYNSSWVQCINRWIPESTKRGTLFTDFVILTEGRGVDHGSKWSLANNTLSLFRLIVEGSKDTTEDSVSEVRIGGLGDEIRIANEVGIGGLGKTFVLDVSLTHSSF